MAFQSYVQQPENQQTVLEFDFRPGNPEVPIGAPITAENGVDPNQPQTLLQVPSPPVMVSLLDHWAEQRKGARVLLVIDVSGSMKERAGSDTRDTKLDLAKSAAIDSLGDFKANDLVGLRVFTTSIGPSGTFEDLVPIGPISQNAQRACDPRSMACTHRTAHRSTTSPVSPSRRCTTATTRTGSTPSCCSPTARTTTARCPTTTASCRTRCPLLRDKSQGELGRPVRVFTIGYGSDADLSVLKQIAEATNAASYNASDPKSISKVFTTVISNF